MNGNGGEQPVAVNIGDCRCSGDPRPHPDGDVVYLSPVPSYRLGLAASAVIGSGLDTLDLQVALGAVFLRYGVVSWNLVDERGKDVPLAPDAVEARLTWDAGGLAVADRAADLYTDAIINPLVARLSSMQGPGQTGGSTSRQSSTRTRRSPKPSSPSPQVPTT